MTADRTPDPTAHGPAPLAPDAGDLAARFRAAAPVLAADPAAIVARGRRRRRATRVAVGALAVAAVAGVTTAAVALLGPGPTPPADAPPPPAVDEGGVALWLSADRVPPGDVAVAAALVSRDGTTATFGVEADLERWDGDSWEPYRKTGLCLADWHCTARWYAPGAPEVQGFNDIGLGVGPGAPGPLVRFTTDGLAPGWYRVVQESVDGVVAHGVLEVADGAPAPAPLWPEDSPAVTVQPPLVPASGGDVALVPLVPPDDGGNLSAEMLSGAMAGLDPDALVQRWADGAWADVGTVATEEPAAESVPGELAARLPALDPGAYRVLLRGNGKELEGSFWVVGDPTSSGDPTPSASDRPAVTCADDDLACLLDAWLAALVGGTGLASEPAVVGPQPDVPYAARAVQVADAGGELARTVGVLVTSTDGPDLGFADPDVEREVAVGDVTVHEGATPDDRAAALVECGGFRFLVRADLDDERTRERTWALAEDLAAGMATCPDDAAALRALLAAAP